MKNITAAITAIHGEVPNNVLSNKDLEKMVDTNDDWIVSRTFLNLKHEVYSFHHPQ